MTAPDTTVADATVAGKNTGKTGRSLARRCAMQALYQWRMTRQAPSEIEASFIADRKLTGKNRDYFLRLINDIPKHIDNIDKLINAHLDRDPDKVDLLEMAILRLGAYELNFGRDIPPKVVLDEAVNLAKLFCAENGYKYINAVLDKIARAVGGLNAPATA